MDDQTSTYGMVGNAADLGRELEWLAAVLDLRLKEYFGGEKEPTPSPPDLARSASSYARFVHTNGLSPAERLVLVLALVPHLRPQLLDILWSRNEATDRGFSEFGGLHGTGHGGFIPTGETVAFILAGDDLSGRFSLMRVFDGDHFFARGRILHLSTATAGEPHLSGALTISSEILRIFTTGVEEKPRFSSEFPARLIETGLEWQDLVLPHVTLEQLEEIRDWILYGQKLLDEWEMRKRLQPGFTALFHGPPGTGKTLSACLLGKYCQCHVYRIDLSMIVSKYIGETEKNLARIFDLAEHKGWILFFDEADSLFGKRTRVDDAHDRYANQEVSFLLQRMEEFNGVVILASNMKGNIDDAFMRRFQSVINFPMPRAAERLRIWNSAFSPKAELDENLDLAKIAERYDLSGGTIMNVVRYASLKALSRRENRIAAEDVEEGICRELQKEGRAV